MKKYAKTLILLFLVLLIAQPAYARLTAKVIKKTKAINKRKIFVTVECNFNGNVNQYMRGWNIDKDTVKADLVKSVKNICTEHRDRLLAETRVAVIDEQINANVGKTITVE